jgi:hypothetical protein
MTCLGLASERWRALGAALASRRIFVAIRFYPVTPRPPAP